MARRNALLALPWVACAIACWPLVRDGFPRGHDWVFELVRVAEYRAALAAGQLPPSWGENLYGGYGSPVFLFYAPLFSAGAALFAWALDSVAAGAALLLVLLTVVSVVTTRRMIASACAWPAGVGPANEVAAAAVRVGVYVALLHPYLLGDKLLRNADAEFAALCFVPIVLEGVLRAGARPRAAFALVSGGLALTILSHNLTALVAVGLALGAGLVLYPPGRSGRTWAVLGAALGFGLALTAFFWLPAVSLTSWVRTEDLLRGKFDFHRQFPAGGAIFGYGPFYATGLVTPAALLAAITVAFRLRDDPRRRLLVGVLGAAVVFLFLTSRASTVVWESAPLLPLFQFPWRWIGPLALVTALAAALAFAGSLAGARPRLRVTIELAVFALCVLNALPLLAQSRPILPQLRTRLPQLLTPEAIRRDGRSVTVLDEYLPRAANPEVWKTRRPRESPVVRVGGAADVVVLRDAGSHIRLSVRAAEPTSLRLARWAFPGWRLELSGRSAEWQANEDGSIDIDVPAGETLVELRYRAPAVRRFGLAASAVALAGWLALVASRRLPLRRNSVS
ncbi:MAG: hypothetical protein OEM05_07475 [Myxococcales bacterium]|nr:hypothetical protein [Myxococcales bacterium]